MPSMLLAAHFPAPPSPGHRGHPAPPTQSHLPVPAGCGLRAQSSAGVEGLYPKDCAFGWPWSHCFPPHRSCNGQKSCQRQPTTTALSPFTSGRSNLQKGRKNNSGPCCILTGEAGGTQGTSESPHRTQEKLPVPRLTLLRKGCKYLRPHPSDTG